MRILHIDFETSSKAKIQDTGTYRYCADPTTEVICVAWAFDDEPVQVSERLPNEIRRHIREGGLVYAHNSAMEEQIFKHVYGIENINMRCTSAIASYHALPASLEALGEHLNLGVKKDKEGSKVLRRHFKTPPDEIPASDAQVIKAYCKQDVEVERAIHKKLGDLPARELQIWQLDQAMNRLGIAVDTELAAIVIEKVEAAKALLNDEISIATGGAVEKPTQAKRIITWLGEQGIDTDNLQAATVTALLEQTDDPVIQQVLLCRQNGAGVATGKYKKALAMAGTDGRVRGNLKYHGATTGRWAGSGLQIQNLPRGSVSDTDTLAELFLAGKDVDEIAGDVFKAAKSAVRPMMRAGSGKKLIVVDYASIEARVLAWLAGEDKLVSEFVSGADIYCSFASEVFGEVVTKENKRKRMVGKVGILGLGYGMGANKFQATLKDWADMEVSVEFAQKVVDRYRNAYSGIKNFWYDLEGGAVDCMLNKDTDDSDWHREDGALCYTLRSGRMLRYQNPRLIQGKFGNPAVKYQKPLGKNMVWTDTYGGKLCENVVQATARDIMSDALVKLDAVGYTLVATVHDEVIIEHSYYSADEQLEHVERIMRENELWSTGCPLDVEGFTTVRYKK